MSELRDAGRMMEAAGQAANAGDLSLADELLRGAARIQEAELGPVHPDLANTLNNLAIVAEKAGRFVDAETFYRRAVAIASTALPPGDPMIAASRENLEDFCRARGLPVDLPAFLTPLVRDTAAGLDAFALEPEAGSGETWGNDVGSADPGFVMETVPPSVSPLPLPRQLMPMAAQPPPPARGRVSPAVVWTATGVVVLVVVAVLVRRPWSREETPLPPPAASATVPPPGDRSLPPPRAQPPAPAPIEPARPPAAVPRVADPRVSTGKPPASSPAPAAVTLATAQLCRTLSTGGANWRCDPAADPVSPGRILFYTRVRSPRDAVVVHRWYRGNALRQSVKLTIRASATEGYRTFSRQTVDGGAEWRVEVRSATGDMIYERRFAVR